MGNACKRQKRCLREGEQVGRRRGASVQRRLEEEEEEELGGEKAVDVLVGDRAMEVFYVFGSTSLSHASIAHCCIKTGTSEQVNERASGRVGGRAIAGKKKRVGTKQPQPFHHSSATVVAKLGFAVTESTSIDSVTVSQGHSVTVSHSARYATNSETRWMPGSETSGLRGRSRQRKPCLLTLHTLAL